jgi:hypothetical protein
MAPFEIPLCQAHKLPMELSSLVEPGRAGEAGEPSGIDQLAHTGSEIIDGTLRISVGIIPQARHVMYNFERQTFGLAQLHECVPDVFSHRIRMPQTAAFQTHEESRNGGFDALDSAGHSSPTFVHGDIDAAVAEQRTVEGGRERTCVGHEYEILHGHDGRDTEPHNLRGDGRERRRASGRCSCGPAGLEHDQLQSGVDPTR